MSRIKLLLTDMEKQLLRKAKIKMADLGYLSIEEISERIGSDLKRASYMEAIDKVIQQFRLQVQSIEGVMDSFSSDVYKVTLTRGAIASRYVFAPILSLGYIGLFAWILKNGVLKWLMVRFELIGKAALSCYVLQNLHINAHGEAPFTSPPTKMKVVATF